MVVVVVVVVVVVTELVVVVVVMVDVVVVLEVVVPKPEPEKLPEPELEPEPEPEPEALPGESEPPLLRRINCFFSLLVSLMCVAASLARCAASSRPCLPLALGRESAAALR